MKVTHTLPPSPHSKSKRKARALREPTVTPPAETAGEISEEARLFQKTKELVKRAPEVRPDKIASLKKKVAAGYRADSAKVAESLVEEHLATDFGKNKL